MLKECILCNNQLTIDNFHKDKSRKDGLNPRCKSCKSKLDAEYKSANKEKIKDKQKVYYLNNTEKMKQKSLQWYEDNIDTQKARMKVYYNENKEHIKKKHDEWNMKNQTKIRTYINAYVKNKYQTDTNFKVKSVLSARLRCFVKNKNASTQDFLGCTFEFFKEWIEFQFNEYMSWNNHGTFWHFDHVRPCSSYNLVDEEEALQCFNWKNIRPLEAKENMSKKDKIDYSIIAIHDNIVKSFVTRRTKDVSKGASGGE